MRNFKFSNITEDEEKELIEIQTCCSFYDFKREYPGSGDYYKWIISTEKQEDILLREFPLAMNRLRPYIVVDTAFAEIRRTSHANDEKFAYRQKNIHTPFEYSDEITGSVFKSANVSDFADEQLECEEQRQMLKQREMHIRKLFSTLSEKQQIRLIKHSVLKKTMREIAEEEGLKSHNSIAKSIQSAVALFEENEDFLFGQVYKIVSDLGDSEKTNSDDELKSLFEIMKERNLL